MIRTIFTYGLFLGLMGLSLTLIEYSFLFRLQSIELYSELIALVFLVVGLWIGRRFWGSKSINDTKVSSELITTPPVGISKREFEVLTLLSQGLSNQEIADKLFLSTNTIKTHTSNLFEKLEVQNRLQAIIKAKKIGILD